MLFSDVIGQKAIIDKLQQLVSNNRLSHALLFIGKEGSGTLPLALAFSSFIMQYFESQENAAQPAQLDMFGEPIVSPNQGNGLNLANQLIHPDVHYSFPVVTLKTGDKPISADYLSQFRNFIKDNPYGNLYDWLQFIDAGNKQGNITAAEVTNIIHKLSLKSYQSEYKILIMWLPEFLDEQGNKLLKLIEEPPPNTLFILVTENEDRLLKTIVSRCQTVHIPPIMQLDVAQHLENNFNLSKEAANRVAILAEGNLRNALNLIKEAEVDWLAMVKDWLNGMVLPNKRAQLIDIIDELSKLGRENQKQLLKFFTYLIHQSTRLIYNQELGQLMEPAEFKIANNLLSRCGPQGLQAIMELLDNATYQIERNVSAKSVLLALSIKLRYVLQNKSIILLH
jgi:DNA polymerase III subunit delta'